MARKDAGLQEPSSPMEEPSKLSEPSSVPSWAIDTPEPSMLVEEGEKGGGGGGGGVGSGLSMIDEGEDNDGGEQSGMETEDVTTTTRTTERETTSRSKSRGSGGKSTMRKRLESVWDRLEMPHSHKMMFAARYAEPRRGLLLFVCLLFIFFINFLV